jgi:hypothetical protein
MLLAAAPRILAQVAPNPAPTKDDTSDEVIELSPFSVSASDEKEGYQVKDTLAGTRVRTELRDVASSISVVNKQFMNDTGVKKAEDLLVYTTNTEVGGLYGNYSGMGGGTTYDESSKLIRPSSNNRVRGLDAADGTRDYFMTEIPWDGYNVDRVDLQRGPNSILFGVGSPAGIVNASMNSAAFKTANSFEIRVDGHGSLRNAADFNYVALPNTLAIRVAVLDDNTNYRQKPAFNHDRRSYVAVRYDPKLFGHSSHTTIKANFESGDVKANRPRMMPPVDALTPWFATTPVAKSGVPALNKLTLDPNTTWNTVNNTNAIASMSGFLGRLHNANMASWYNAGSSTPTRVMTPIAGTLASINASGVVDGKGIDAIPFTHLWAVSGYSMFASHSKNAMPGGSYYSNYSITDSSVFDFYSKLMDGENKQEWQDWKAGNISLSQSFLDNRAGFEMVYDTQAYNEGQSSIFGSGEYMITVDMNTKLADGNANPNVGRPAIGSNGQYGNSSTSISRDNLRLTTFVDIKASDFLEKGVLTRMLGHHVITGLVSEEQKVTKTRSWVRYAVEEQFAKDTGQLTALDQGARQWEYLVYLGQSMVNKSSASGMNLSNLNMTIAPTPTTTLRYYDSRWNAGTTVDPAAVFTYPDINADGSITQTTSTQSENPANYKGWTTGTYKTLSADNGDIDKLTNRYAGQKKVVNSQAFTWQGYMFDDVFVPVFGWRRDIIRGKAAMADLDANKVVSSYKLAFDQATPTKTVGESKSWGGVLHTPKSIRNRLPGKTDISVFYNRSENFKADAARADIAGNIIDNPRANTKEYGVAVSTLEDKLTLKVTWYKTRMKNADLGYSKAGFGDNLYYAWAVPTWIATHALCLLDASNNTDGGGWPWDNVAGVWNDDAHTSRNYARMKTIVKDVFTNFPASQAYLDEYGIPFNLAKMHSNNESDWVAAVPKANFWDLGLQPTYKEAFRSTGTGAVATVDTLSKGVEYELSAQPTKNLSISINASKTTASRTDISPTLVSWIDTWTKYLAGDAGLITMWGGNSFRDEWKNKILAPYSVLKMQQGSSAPEVSPWRANTVATYTFDHGFLKDVWVGGAYRWEDKQVLGYALTSGDPSTVTIDINKPFYGPTTDHVDMWIGYKRKLTSKIDWQIQLNLRNVFENKKLVPVTIQPNGEASVFRIQEGMAWQLTNTFKF